MRSIVGFSELRGLSARASPPPSRPTQRVRFRDDSPPMQAVHRQGKQHCIYLIIGRQREVSDADIMQHRSEGDVVSVRKLPAVYPSRWQLCRRNDIRIDGIRCCVQHKAILLATTRMIDQCRTKTGDAGAGGVADARIDDPVGACIEKSTCERL